MSASWPIVALGDVLAHRKEFVVINDLQNYKRPRVQLHAQGIVLRDEVPGALIKTKKQQVCGAGELLVAEIDAKVGGFGLVPPSLGGAIVSSHYFLFVADEVQLDHRFLEWFVKTPGFRDQVEAQGSTNYAAIRSADVLGYRMPLPPLAEQRRIVARIEEVAGKVEEARRLRHQSTRQAAALRSSAATALLEEARWPIQTVGTITGDKGLQNGKSVKSTGVDIGVYCLTLSSMRNGRINLADNKPIPMTAEQARPFLVRAGDVFIVRGNGSKSLCALAGLADTGSDAVIFPDLFIRVSLPKGVRPDYFVAVWNSGSTRRSIEAKAKTTSGIWKVNQGHIKSTAISVPPLDEQERITQRLAAVQESVSVLAAVRERTGRELDALLPAVLDRAFKGEL